MVHMKYNGLVFQENESASEATIVYTCGVFAKCVMYHSKQPAHDIAGAEVIEIPEFILANNKTKLKVVAINGGAFNFMRDIVEIYIPKSIRHIKWCFWKCTNLQRIVVDPENENYCDIDGVLFSKSKKELVAYPNARSGEYRVPNGVRQIGNCAFKNTTVERIVMPKSLLKIGTNAFYDCKQLKEILNIPQEIVEVNSFHNPDGNHSVNPTCHMANGETMSLYELINLYQRKKK